MIPSTRGQRGLAEDAGGIDMFAEMGTIPGKNDKELFTWYSNLKYLLPSSKCRKVWIREKCRNLVTEFYVVLSLQTILKVILRNGYVKRNELNFNLKGETSANLEKYE
ncbi:hypothetical protein AVEN_62435-1 [Araneus ventricosus]|uniref:Uncharacterized protein n=1 Tax=Araneus ventricosus TaxID=182803 RepID=A0A4Y2TAV3_ARAVE|nr:hypothetical protein AVEN_62435-1 [Araneus ventricosus]